MFQILATENVVNESNEFESLVNDSYWTTNHYFPTQNEANFCKTWIKDKMFCGLGVLSFIKI